MWREIVPGGNCPGLIYIRKNMSSIGVASDEVLGARAPWSLHMYTKLAVSK